MASKSGETGVRRAQKDCKESKINALKLSVRKKLVSLLTMLNRILCPLNIFMNISRLLDFSSITS